eukprot:3730621-Amphidinium_carterae.1
MPDALLIPVCNLEKRMYAVCCFGEVTVFQYATTTDDRGRDSEWIAVAMNLGKAKLLGTH